MATNILKKVLNSEISVDETLEWLTTDNPYNIALTDIEQNDSTRVEFIFHFLDYLRKQCQGVLHLATDDGLERYQKLFHGESSRLNKNVTAQELNNSKDNSGNLSMNMEENIESPIAINPTICNTSKSDINASTLNVYTSINSYPQIQMNPGILQYESPQSHSSPLKDINFASCSIQEINSPSHTYHSPNTSKSQTKDSYALKLSVTSAIPCSPISPSYSNQMSQNKSRMSDQNNSRISDQKKSRISDQNKSRMHYNRKKSSVQNANNGQTNIKSKSNHSLQLGDFIVQQKLPSKNKNKNDSADKSAELSHGELNNSIKSDCSNETPQKYSRSKRRIKPTKLAVNTSTENQQQETFGVVSRPSTANPTFLEAMSKVETKKVTSFEDERELLKLQRQKQPIIAPLTNAGQRESIKIPINSKQTLTMTLSLDLVDSKNILDIMAQLYGGLLIKNLVSNPMTELYFIILLITSQHRANIEINKLKENSEFNKDVSCNDAESLKELKESMGCTDLIDDNFEENNESITKTSVEENDDLSISESNEKINEKSIDNQQQYLNTGHNCVYFATNVLWNIRNLLSVIDRPTVALLCENTLVKTFHPQLQEFLSKLYDDKCLQSKNIKPYDYSRTDQLNVCFEVDTDNRDNFPSLLAFSTFRKQRDLFYEILKTWENNHLNQNWYFHGKLGSTINKMLSMHSDAVNYYHIARLFKSQLLMSSITIGQTEHTFHDANLDVLKSLKDLNPEKLQQLQQRLITPISSMGPVPPPSFPGIQEFYKDFILSSLNPKFTTILRDCFIKEIMELNDTQFACSDITKESKVDESTKQNYLLCVLSLRLIAKFLGFLISLPYQSERNTIQSETAQIALRSRIIPPLNLQECLYQAVVDKKLSLTIPWMVQYLAMLDSVSFRLPYYLNICKSLYCIYRDIQYSLYDETVLLLAFSIGWFFELSNFPKDIYFHWIGNFHIQNNELINDVSIYKRRRVLSITDDVDNNVDQNNIAIDDLNIVDDRALYTCCPYLKELKILLTTGNLNINSNNANRHITPVSSKLSQASTTTRTISLELKLEEAFFHGHPRSVRRTVDFIVERITSNCVKFITRTIIPAAKEQSFKAMKKSNDISMCNKSNRIHDLIASASTKIRDQCDELLPEMCERKTKISMESLLADDVLQAVKDMCVKIAVRMEIEQINQWLDLYINNAMTSDKMFSKYELSKIDSDKKDDCETVDDNTKIQTYDPDALPVTTIINEIRNSLWELLENNGQWSILTEETILKNVNNVYLSLDELKYMGSNVNIVMCRISVDYAIHIIGFRSDLFTPNVEEKFIEIWKTYNNNSNSSDKLLSGLLCPRNVRILMLTGDNKVWIKYGKFLSKILQNDLVNMDSFSNDCVALLRYEWDTKILQSLSKCINEAIDGYKSDDECVGRILTLLDWIIQTCGTMDGYH